MAHQFEESDSMAWGGQVPWHGLGKQLPSDVVTAEEMLEYSGLDWGFLKRQVIEKDHAGNIIEQNEVPGVPVYAPIGDGKVVVVPNKYAMVRNDNYQPVGVVGAGYVPILNRESFNFLDEVTGTKEAKYHVAGSLFGGARVFVVLKLPEPLQITNQDIVDKYLTLVNSHDGSLKLTAFYTPIRVVCNNTLTAAVRGMKKEHAVKIRHTGNILNKLVEAKEILGFAERSYAKLGDVFSEFVKLDMVSNSLQLYFERVVNMRDAYDEKGNLNRTVKTRKDNQIALLTSIFENPLNAMPQTRGSLWAAYNSVTEYADHHKITRNMNNDVDPRERRMQSILFASSAKLKQRAFDLATEMIAA